MNRKVQLVGNSSIEASEKGRSEVALNLSSSGLFSVDRLVANHRNQYKVKEAVSFPHTRLSVTHKGWKTEPWGNYNSPSSTTPCEGACRAHGL